MSQASLVQCVCGAVVLRDAWGRKFAGGSPHRCAEVLLVALQEVTAEALDGVEGSAQLVPEVIEAWLLRR